MKIRTTIAWVAILMCEGCIHKPPTADEAARAYAARDYDSAFKSWSYLAQKDDTVAEYQVGMMYSRGEGVSKDDVQAFQWTIKSADTGYVLAELAMGQMYLTGTGVSPNPAEAM
jgi:TPR repeat protein